MCVITVRTAAVGQTTVEDVRVCRLYENVYSDQCRHSLTCSSSDMGADQCAKLGNM